MYIIVHCYEHFLSLQEQQMNIKCHVNYHFSVSLQTPLYHLKFFHQQSASMVIGSYSALICIVYKHVIKYLWLKRIWIEEPQENSGEKVKWCCPQVSLAGTESAVCEDQSRFSPFHYLMNWGIQTEPPQTFKGCKTHSVKEVICFLWKRSLLDGVKRLEHNNPLKKKMSDFLFCADGAQAAPSHGNYCDWCLVTTQAANKRLSFHLLYFSVNSLTTVKMPAS